MIKLKTGSYLNSIQFPVGLIRFSKPARSLFPSLGSSLMVTSSTRRRQKPRNVDSFETKVSNLQSFQPQEHPLLLWIAAAARKIDEKRRRFSTVILIAAASKAVVFAYERWRRRRISECHYQIGRSSPEILKSACFRLSMFTLFCLVSLDSYLYCFSAWSCLKVEANWWKVLSFFDS